MEGTLLLIVAMLGMIFGSLLVIAGKLADISYHIKQKGRGENGN
jgi:hypothetical protein